MRITRILGLAAAITVAASAAIASEEVAPEWPWPSAAQELALESCKKAIKGTLINPETAEFFEFTINKEKETVAAINIRIKSESRAGLKITSNVICMTTIFNNKPFIREYVSANFQGESGLLLSEKYIAISRPIHK